MKRNLLFLSLLGSSLAIHAQSLTAVTGLKLFEHHSSSINNGAPFGSGANGSKSGYDFVTRNYFNSFNPSNFGAYTNGEEANIDMVEHNGRFGNNGKFGFTSGVSTIWNGDIKGNNLTVWMEAPASFNYNTVNNVSQVVAAFNPATATKSIAEVKENQVYLVAYATPICMSPCVPTMLKMLLMPTYRIYHSTSITNMPPLRLQASAMQNVSLR